MTVHRISSRPRRRLLAAIATASLALTGLAVTSSSPAQAALPPQCVTSGSVVTCTLSQNTSTSTMALQIPADVASIQIHAVGEKGEGARGTGEAPRGGGKPAAIDASIPVAEGEIFTADLLDDGGDAGASSGGITAGAGGSSVKVTRGSDVIVQAAGGGGAGAFVPVLNGGQYPYSAGGSADQRGFEAADTDPSGHYAIGGESGADQDEGGFAGTGAWTYTCPGFLVFSNGSNGTSSAGGQGGDGEYAGGGGGGGSLGGGGGGAGGTGCEGYSYGAGGGGGGSIVPSNATYSWSTTESYLVRITFTLIAHSTHSPSAMSFGLVPVGSSSAFQTMTVTNTGSTPLTLGNGVLGGANPGHFRKSNDSCSSATVAPGAVCKVSLQFRPLSAGTLSATFTLADNSQNSPHVVALTGTGSQPVVQLSESSLDFGAQEVGKTGPTRTVSVTNVGNAPLVVSTATVGGASDFTVVLDSCTGASVAPDDSCSVSVRMTPSVVGQRSGTITIRHNAVSQHSFVSLTGIGTPPADLKILGIGSLYTGRDHLVTRTVAGPGKLMTYPLVIFNEDTVARSYRIAVTKSGSAATAEVWTTGFGAKQLPKSGSTYVTATVQPRKTVAYSLRVTPTAPGQTISGADVALLSSDLGLIEQVRTQTNTAAPLNGTSSYELFSRQGSQPFVGGPVSGQTSTGPALNVGGSAPFTLRLKNNGTSSQRIGLRLTDMDGCAGTFAVTVTAAGKSVTTAAFNGTYVTPLLAPTKFQDVFVSIKRVASGCPGKTIRAQSLNNGASVRTSYLLANVAYNAATD